MSLAQIQTNHWKKGSLRHTKKNSVLWLSYLKDTASHPNSGINHEVTEGLTRTDGKYTSSLCGIAAVQTDVKPSWSIALRSSALFFFFLFFRAQTQSYSLSLFPRGRKLNQPSKVSQSGAFICLWQTLCPNSRAPSSCWKLANLVTSITDSLTPPAVLINYSKTHTRTQRFLRKDV